ncbi:MAG: 1-acyl-sn-glycerol-3-phosphate acyltransferase [Alloprevotella sp.]|nr:1-acyl-sn-glycerol-3-phosphate acyltransferase [Alloprevotella sp.]
MKLLYRIYQLLIVLPLGVACTIVAATITSIGCTFGNGHFWGYHPARIWAWTICRLLLLPVRVERHADISDNQSYVFIANHQGSLDIFLVYAFLGRNFKWMMKQSLRNIPFVGYACMKSRHIFVDNTKASHIKHSIEQGRDILQGGTSLTVFPEGARTFTGKMRPFHKGAFSLACELGLPIVPITINGCFRALPRTKGFYFVNWTPLELIIHRPIDTRNYTADTMNELMDESHRIIESRLKD